MPQAQHSVLFVSLTMMQIWNNETGLVSCFDSRFRVRKWPLRSDTFQEPLLNRSGIGCNPDSGEDSVYLFTLNAQMPAVTLIRWQDLPRKPGHAIRCTMH